MSMARIGVLVDRKAAERRWTYGLNVFERYMEEVLSHAGMAFQKWESAREAVEASPDVLIAALAGEDEETTVVLWEYAERGGTILSCGGLNPFAVKLGSELAGVYGSGYARFGEAYGKADSVRFLSARPWRVKDAGQGLQSELGLLHKESPDGVEIGAALQEFAIGQGRLVRWSVDIADTIVRLQQGTEPVLTDGVPARDGSGPINENILKADDRCAMDWDHDRLHTETGYPYYAYPYADYWRELFLGRLLRTVVDKGLTLPFVGYWPEESARSR
ncbi:hypothetical protein N6H14_12815 [Paenibacillus sp. CC-CFT747]|nr:hypothetical protein N6H14_12815 [Paenibacillus sp. CC-CFT747]